MNGSQKSPDTISINAETYLTPPELLISAVLHLISQYNKHNPTADTCMQSAATIERHLRTLSTWPELAPMLRATCQQLSDQWMLSIEKALAKQKTKRSVLITRLFSGPRAM